MADMLIFLLFPKTSGTFHFFVGSYDKISGATAFYFHIDYCVLVSSTSRLDLIFFCYSSLNLEEPAEFSFALF